MTLKIHQVLLAIVLIVIGASLQYYTDGLPIGTLAFVVGLVWFLFGLAKHQTSYLALPFNQLEQATVPEQLPSLAIPLVTKNGSAAFLVMMVFVLPSLWLGVYLLVKVINHWAWFTLFISLLVLGFSWLSTLAMVSEMQRDTTPTQHGSLTITSQVFHINFKGRNYHLNWFELRDIVASDGAGNSKQVILVMSIAGNLQELVIQQHECSVEIRKLTTFLQHYRIKAQGRQVPTIS